MINKSRTRQQGILQMLKAGNPGKPIPSGELCMELCITERELRRRVEELRRAGEPVCSSTAPRRSGYWLGNHAEIERFRAGYKRYAVSMLKTAQRMKPAPEGQASLFDLVEKE